MAMIFDIQKASLTKRLVAFILDAILFAVLAVGFAWLIGLACDYDTHLDCNVATQEAYTTYYKRAYGVDFSKTYDDLSEAEKALWDQHSEQFSNAVSGDAEIRISLEKLLAYQSKYLKSHGVDLLANENEYTALSDEQKATWLTAYNACQEEIRAEYGENALLMKPIAYVLTFEDKHDVNLTASASEKAGFSTEVLNRWIKAYNKCDKALATDVGYGARMMKLLGFTLMMVSLGILLSMVILEFTFPLLFKNGQTIGKKVFGIAVIHQNGVKINTITLFIRTFLGKYAVETMCPVLLVLMLFTSNAITSVIVMALLIIFELVIFIWKKDTRPFIHDVFAKTVCVDLASQMIFESEAEMLAFKRNAYAETSGDSAQDLLYGTSKALSESFVEIDNKTSDKNNGSGSTN